MDRFRDNESAIPFTPRIMEEAYINRKDMDDTIVVVVVVAVVVVVVVGTIVEDDIVSCNNVSASDAVISIPCGNRL